MEAEITEPRISAMSKRELKVKFTTNNFITGNYLHLTTTAHSIPSKARKE